MDKKIRVLCVPSDNGGCGLHRSLMPHIRLGELYSEDFDIVVNYNMDWRNLDYVNSFDIIHFHKGCYSDMKAFHDALDFCKKNNIVTVMDIDDYWDLGQHHPLSNLYKLYKTPEIIINNMYKSDYITTTTSIFAKQIEKTNKNVKVFVNALDRNRVNPILFDKKKSERLRIGFVMGSTHEHDMELVEGLANRLSKDILDKIQFVLCGYDLRGTMTEILPNGETRNRPMLPEESVWFRYEQNITDNYRIVSPEYKEFLLNFVQADTNLYENEGYKRCWTKPVDNYKYMEHYKDIDVLLVPLQGNSFNACKSELKFVEAGMMDVAVVASNFGPYTIGSDNFFKKGGEINEKGNCILIDNNKSHKDWVKAIKKLVENPQYVEMLKKNMCKHVEENYDMDKITAERAIWYKEICKRK